MLTRQELLKTLQSLGVDISGTDRMGDTELNEFLRQIRDNVQSNQPEMAVGILRPGLSVLEQFVQNGDVRVSIQLLHVPPEENQGVSVIKDRFMVDITFPMLTDEDKFKLLGSGAGETFTEAFSDALRDFALYAKRGYENRDRS